MKTFIILYYYFQAKLTMRFSPTFLKRWQKYHIKKIHKFAKKHSSFYQNHLGKCISKKEMMTHFSTFNTKGIDKEFAYSLALKGEETRDFQSIYQSITIGLSSGTSGNRGIFLVSKKERYAWCGNMLAKLLIFPPWRKQKIALFLRANSALYETVNSRSLQFVFFDLLEEIPLLQKKVAALNPDILVAPPSMLHFLANSCHPKKVISVAETLFSQDEEILKQAFNQPIFQVYQCTEGFLAFTCSAGKLHLNEDLIYFEKEYIDKTHFVPIITDLHRKTQPMIRYRLDDVLEDSCSLSCICGCPFQIIQRIEGRQDDLLYVEHLNGEISPLFPDFVSRSIIQASSELKEYGIIQTKLDEWQVYIEKPFQDLVLESFHQLFKRIKAIPPTFVFISSPLPKPLGSKLRRIRRSYVHS